jgi:glycine cleavage system protein P-like pyridoxal-binding family
MTIFKPVVHVSHPSSFRPICVAEHLAPFLPSHPLVQTGGDKAINAICAGPFGSASILLISWAYIKMLGGDGLSHSTNVALLNANYMAERLAGHYTLRFKNANGRVAHELLIDLAEFDKAAGLKVTDFAKRLQVSRSDLTVTMRLNYVDGRITGSIHQLARGPFRRVCSLNLPSQRLFRK